MSVPNENINADITREVQLNNTQEATWTNNDNDSATEDTTPKINQTQTSQVEVSITQFQERLNAIYQAGLRVIEVGDDSSIARLNELNEDINNMSRRIDDLSHSTIINENLQNINDNETNNKKKTKRKQKEKELKNIKQQHLIK
jgi:TolA-binding protein